MHEFGHSSPSLQFALSISTEIVLRFDKHVQSCNCHQNLEYYVYHPHQKSLMSPSQLHPQPWQPLTCFLPCVCLSAQSGNHVPLCNPKDCSQIPLSMRFPMQVYWSGLPFPSPGDLPDPGIEPTSPALQADSLPLSHLGSPFFPIVFPFSECHTNGIIQFVLSNLASFIPQGAFLLLSQISGTDVPVKYGM